MATLTNPEVIAIDQDSLGLQGVKVASYGDGLEVWSKALSTPGERAVLLLNRTGDPASIKVNWSDLGLADSVARHGERCLGRGKTSAPSTLRILPPFSRSTRPC